MTSTAIESKLLTDRSGPSTRVRVDPGQTGFFAGRMFRSFFSGMVPLAGPAVAFRFTSPVDFVLWRQALSITQGALQLSIFTGATPSGSWSQLPVIGVNRMGERPTPLYSPVVTIETGGSFTGGTQVDTMLLRAGANQGNQSSQNVGGETTERGLPAGVYFGSLATLTGGAGFVAVADPAQFLMELTWEERVPNLNGPQ